MAAKSEITSSDGAFLLDALRHVASPVIINAGEIAMKKGAKVNTIVKRFSEIKKRYNINIQTTAAGYSPAKKTCPSAGGPGKVTKSASGGSKAKKMSSARKAAIEKAVAGQDWNSSDGEAGKVTFFGSLSDIEQWNGSFGVGGRP